MAFRKNSSDLAWTNITRVDCNLGTQQAWDMFMTAKAELETMLASEARSAGIAQEGDAFKFSYRTIGQGTIGMAIAEPEKSRSAGFEGLRRPKPVESLANWQRGQDVGGYRR